MAEACTCYENKAGRKIHRIKWSWTSSSDGNVSAATVMGRVTALKYTGKIYDFVTDPSATSPSDNYDITIKDDDGVDVIRGQGANRDASVTEYAVDRSALGVVVDSTLTLTVANAGDSKKGDVYLYIETL